MNNTPKRTYIKVADAPEGFSVVRMNVQIIGAYNPNIPFDNFGVYDLLSGKEYFIVKPNHVATDGGINGCLDNALKALKAKYHGVYEHDVVLEVVYKPSFGNFYLLSLEATEKPKPPKPSERDGLTLYYVMIVVLIWYILYMIGVILNG